MNHTVRQGRADWADIPQASRTRWQQVAAATYGVVTPGNAVTAFGLSLSLAGVLRIYNGALGSGIALLAAGRMADMADGWVADNTHTKSPVGEALDAGCDKLVAGVVFIAFLAGHIIPLLPLVVLLAQAIINTVSSVVAKYRRVELHPSALGKRAMVVEWLAVFCFLLARLLAPHSVFLADVCNAAGYIGLAVFVVWGADASVGYVRHALRAGPAKSYTDDTGRLHSMAGRLLRAYWRRTWLVIVSAVLAAIILFVLYCLAARPYSGGSLVRTPAAKGAA